MDCSATLDGVQVQYFSASRTCTGVMTTMVYPVGSSYGSNCYPVMNTYFSQALNLYNLGLMSFSPMCMFVNAQNPGIPVDPIYTYSAIVESVYQSSVGCAADSIFQLPDNWKAFLQTPLLTSHCASVSSTSLMKRAIAPYNTNAIGQMTCPSTGAIIAFAGNFDGACVVPVAINQTSMIKYNKCYGPSTVVGGGVSPSIEGDTIDNFSDTSSITLSLNHLINTHTHTRTPLLHTTDTHFCHYIHITLPLARTKAIQIFVSSRAPFPRCLHRLP